MTLMAMRNSGGKRWRGAATARIAVAIVAAIVTFGGAARRATAQEFSVDQKLSEALTTDLRGHLLPLVGAQVGTNASGARRVVLYGYVATEKGKSDAEKRARDYLGAPTPEIDDHIVIQPEIARLRPRGDASAGGDALGTANQYSGASGAGVHGETFDQVYQQIQRYGVRTVPDDGGLGAP